MGDWPGVEVIVLSSCVSVREVVRSGFILTWLIGDLRERVAWLVGRVAGRNVGVLFELGMGLRGFRYVGFRADVLGSDEPESLILAQSERWRHA